MEFSNSILKQKIVWVVFVPGIWVHARKEYHWHLGSCQGRNTTHTIFCLRMLLEKWTEGQKAVHCVFIDLEKA